MGRFTVIRDTREKKGHGWWYEEDAHCIGTETAKVDIGDYAIKDKEHILCIERKESVSEFAGNCGEKRFLQQLKAMSSFPYAFLLFEFGWHQIEQYPEGSGIPKNKWSKIRIRGKYLMRVIASAQIEHGIHVVACGDKRRAEEIAFRIMRHVNDLQR
jgi:ERCC4-type nuclease